MPSNYARTISYFSLGGLLLGSIVMISLWGPESGLLQDAYRAESERLFQSFTWPLAKATAQNDDLAQIDLAAGYRLTSHTQLKVQYSYQHETTGPGDDNHMVAAQLTTRF